MLRDMIGKHARTALKIGGFIALTLLVIGVLVITGMLIWLADFVENGFRSGPWSD